MNKKTCGVYVHTPFCLKKCYYCDFNSYSGCEHLFDDYVNALCKEIEQTKLLGFDYPTVFFGGGTPTILSVNQLEKIVQALQNAGFWQDMSEKTCEVNPETATVSKLAALKQMGFNRLSFGVQSFSDKLLKTIGRVHDAQTAKNAINFAQELGFNNINIDLMFALPEQNLAEVKKSIDTAIELKVQHISVYELILEEDTILDKLIQNKKLSLPNEDNQEVMYDFATSYLPDNNYKRYEISNYCIEGYECKHNKQYWHYKDYIGFGAGATSFIDNVRWTNNFEVEKYIYNRKEKNSLEQIDDKTAMAEFMFMGLRTTAGVCPKEFYKRFNKDVFEIYKQQLQEHKQNKLINIKDNISLTNKGMKIGNKIFLTFLPLDT